MLVEETTQTSLAENVEPKRATSSEIEDDEIAQLKKALVRSLLCSSFLSFFLLEYVIVALY